MSSNVNECKPLPRAHPRAVDRHVDSPDVVVVAVRQGLTLAHFSAQLEPCLSQENTLYTLKHPLTPTEHGLHNPYAHPLSHANGSSCAETWTNVSPCRAPAPHSAPPCPRAGQTLLGTSQIFPMEADQPHFIPERTPHVRRARLKRALAMPPRRSER